VPIVCFLPIRLSKSRGVENDHHLLLKILGQLSVDLFLYFCPHCIVQLLSAVFTISAIVVSASIFFCVEYEFTCRLANGKETWRGIRIGKKSKV
jgi:hypothetical protein